MTLSFQEISAKTKLPVESIEGSITKMVQQKAISARINKKQSTVDFIDSEREAEDD